MKLLTKAILADFKKHANDPDDGNPYIVAKFFNPQGGQTWYAVTYEPIEANHEGKPDAIIYGYMTGGAYDEWGTIYETDLKTPLPPFGLPCERDLYFDPGYFNDLKGEGVIAA